MYYYVLSLVTLLLAMGSTAYIAFTQSYTLSSLGGHIPFVLPVVACLACFAAGVLVASVKASDE